MTVDTESEVDNSTSSNVAETTATPTAGTADQMGGASEATGAQAAPDAANAATQEAPASGSLTTPKTQAAHPDGKSPPVAGVPATTAPQTHDWQKRYGDLQRHAQQEMEKLRASNAELMRFREEQLRAAEQSKLKRWNKAHPEHGQFTSLLAKGRTVGQQIANIQRRADLSPEAKAAAIEAAGSVLSEAEQSELSAYQQDNQDFSRDFHADPRGSIVNVALPVIREEIQEAFRQMQVHQQASAAVDKDFNDPEFKAAVAANNDDFQAILRSGTPYAVAKELMILRHRQANAASVVGDAERVAAAARTQTNLAKERASITRDPQSQPVTDLRALAKQIAKEQGKDWSTLSPESRFRLMNNASERIKQTK